MILNPVQRYYATKRQEAYEKAYEKHMKKHMKKKN